MQDERAPTQEDILVGTPGAVPYPLGQQSAQAMPGERHTRLAAPEDGQAHPDEGVEPCGAGTLTPPPRHLPSLAGPGEEGERLHRPQL